MWIAPAVIVSGGGLRLAFAVLGDDDQLREPGLDIDMEVEPGPGLTAGAADRPGDRGGGLEEGAVDGEDLTMQGRQRPGGLGRPRFEDFAPEVIEDRLQSGRVGQLVEVGEGALAEFADGEVFLSLSRLAEILHGPEGSQRGVEKGEEVGDKDVVEEEVAIAVGISLPELVDEPFEGVDVLGPDDLLGPDRQVAQARRLRLVAVTPSRRRSRSSGWLLGRH